MTETHPLPKFALSIRQPWAWAICYAGKDVENRSWPTRFRGPVAIHAAKGMTRDECASFSEVFGDLRWQGHVSGSGPHYASLPRGGIVGTAVMTDCVQSSESPWFFGKYGFILADVQPVDFIPCKGALGFFEWQPVIGCRV